ncbi:8351_t:CDS:1, partial [Racocetra fulgida]
MYPTIQKLIQYLNDIYIKLIISEIQDVCKTINESMLKHWDEPKETGLIASYLNLYFKNLCFLSPSEKIETINLIRTKITNLSDLSAFTTSNNPIQNTYEHMMSKFFDDDDTDTHLLSLDVKLQLYD